MSRQFRPDVTYHDLGQQAYAGEREGEEKKKIHTRMDGHGNDIFLCQKASPCPRNQHISRLALEILLRRPAHIAGLSRLQRIIVDDFGTGVCVRKVSVRGHFDKPDRIGRRQGCSCPLHHRDERPGEKIVTEYVGPKLKIVILCCEELHRWEHDAAMVKSVSYYKKTEPVRNTHALLIRTWSFVSFLQTMNKQVGKKEKVTNF